MNTEFETKPKTETEVGDTRNSSPTALLERIRWLESENKQLYAMLKDDENVEEICIKMLEPLVGYDRDLPYVLRLPNAVRRLSVIVNDSFSNVKVRDADCGAKRHSSPQSCSL